MTKLQDLMSLDLLGEMLDEGYVKIQRHPTYNYTIYNYADKAQFDSMWNEVTTQCRGLIVDDTGEVIARPFRKFFNYGQAEAPQFDLNTPVLAHDKMDGSLGIIYPTPDGGYAVATRGSFASDQARHATALLNKTLEKAPSLGDIFAHRWTILVEIVYSANRIVLDYGDRDELVLLGAVNIDSGKYVDPGHCFWVGSRAERMPYRTFGEAIAAPPRKNREGMVLFVPDSGSFVKIKQEDYISLHKAIFGLNERGLWEFAQNHEDPFSPSMYREALNGMPDETYSWIESTLEDLQQKYDDLYDRAKNGHELIVNSLWDLRELEPGHPLFRKEYAEMAVKSPLKALLFLTLDNRHGKMVETIWKMIKPEGGKLYRADTGDTGVEAN